MNPLSADELMAVKRRLQHEASVRESHCQGLAQTALDALNDLHSRVVLLASLKRISLWNRTGFSIEGASGDTGAFVLSSGCSMEFRPDDPLYLDRVVIERMPRPTDPIPMRLTCPSCNTLHIDEGEFATKPHHTHSCQQCGLTWRPAVVNTVGVQFLPGFKNP